MAIPSVDLTTLNNLSVNLDIGDIADPALRLQAFQYLYNKLSESVADLNAFQVGGAIKTVNLADGNVVTVKLADNAVTGPKILDGAIITAKLADGNVTTLKIADGNITRVKLADKVVGAGQLDDAAVGQIHHQDNGIPSRAIGDNVILQRHLSDNSVGSAEIQTGAVTASKIPDGTINSQHIDAALLASSASLSTQAEFDKRGVNVEKFGAKGDGTTDDQTYIRNAINDVASKGGGVLYLMPLHLINGSIDVPSNVSIKALTKTVIKSTTNTNRVFNILANADNVEIENITFDYGSVNSNTAVYVNENVTNLRLSKLTFKNFYDINPNTEQNVLRLNTGIEGTITDITFKNIKKVGNGVITDGAGAGRCIKTNTFGVSVFKNYSLIIDRVRIDDCYNVDASGNFIVEDSDPICFQHGSSAKGYINLSNVTAKNFSKRLVKIQGNGVNLTNITVDSDIDVPWLIYANANDINISNVVARGSIRTVVQITDADNVSVSNININSNFVGAQPSEAAFHIINSKNISINQVTGYAPSAFAIYAGVVENVVIDNVNLTCSSAVFYINYSSSNAANRIKNITVSNMTCIAPTADYTASLAYVKGDTLSTTSLILFRNIKIIANQTYSFGLVRADNIQDLKFDGLYIENMNNSGSIELFRLNNVTCEVRGLDIKGVAGLKDVAIMGTSKLLVTRSKIANAHLSGTSVTLELEKTPAALVYTSSATSAQVTIT